MNTFQISTVLKSRAFLQYFVSSVPDNPVAYALKHLYIFGLSVFERIKFPLPTSVFPASWPDQPLQISTTFITAGICFRQMLHPEISYYRMLKKIYSKSLIYIREYENLAFPPLHRLRYGTSWCLTYLQALTRNCLLVETENSL